MTLMNWGPWSPGWPGWETWKPRNWPNSPAWYGLLGARQLLENDAKARNLTFESTAEPEIEDDGWYTVYSTLEVC